MMELPESHVPYTDKYFLRARTILQGDGLNPDVTMRVFIRKGPGRVYGVLEALEILKKYAPDPDRLRVFALPEGSEYAPTEPLMHIEGPIQDFIELETMYLGVLTAAVTEANDGRAVTPAEAAKNAAMVRELVPDKHLMYFGARHWHWSMDAEISKAVINVGFDSCSTDIGAWAAGLGGGVGTIPHALVLVYAHAYGKERATAEATLGFDRHIDKAAPRIALVDTFNREIEDSLGAAGALGDRLYGVRLDTAGECLGQGGLPFDGRKHVTGKGVTVESVRAVRKALDENGFSKVNIVLSSGFGDSDKLKAFCDDEKARGRLFESLGIGGLFASRFATADIVRVEGRELAKTGRGYVENPRMIRML
jgi:nicotinate phosphoribosyltransferase